MGKEKHPSSPPCEPTLACPAAVSSCPFKEELLRLKKRCRELEEICQTDALTGFFNYRYLVQALEGEMERTRRTGLTTGLIMLDLDHFKRINDTYGHEAGNQALVHVAGSLRKMIRRIDLPCRYGGEEFLIILPATELHLALRTAERLRMNLQASPMELTSHAIKLTASFGVDAFSVHDQIGSGELIQRVDRWVLEAKENGRNRVCHDMERVKTMATEVTDAERKGLFLGH